MVNIIEPDRILTPNQYSFEINETNVKQGIYLISLDIDHKHQAVAKLIIK
jgi:hypothetical protein